MRWDSWDWNWDFCCAFDASEPKKDQWRNPKNDSNQKPNNNKNKQQQKPNNKKNKQQQKQKKLTKDDH